MVGRCKANYGRSRYMERLFVRTVISEITIFRLSTRSLSPMLWDGLLAKLH